MRYGWSIESIDWEMLPKGLLQADRWSSSTVHALHKVSVPESPGVYVFCSTVPGRSRVGSSQSKRSQGLFDILYNVLYVGQASNLRNRFLSHCNHPAEDILRTKTCFPEGLEFWFTVLQKEQLDVVEYILIQCFGPPANRVSGIRAKITGGVAIQ